MQMESIPSSSWSRRFDAEEPTSSVHTFSRPPMLEALSLLPIAYRVGSYISNERSRGSEPIFDLSGLCLEPPKPGPHAGAPLGGLGGGSIGRGFRGEFRRWSLEPGRYVHRVITADVFSLRVNRGNQVFAQVLSVQKCNEGSPLASWDWNLPASCGTYHALYPRAWTVYENPVPDITVIIEQVSPFLPGSYSESSLPCAVFQVEVVNTSTTSGAEVSVMFSFQNGYGGGSGCTACGNSASNQCCSCNTSGSERATANTSAWDCSGGLIHSIFSVADDLNSLPEDANCSDKKDTHSWRGQVSGVCMTHPSASPASGGNCTRCAQRSSSSPPFVPSATMDRSPAAHTTAETTTTTQSTTASPLPPSSPVEEEGGLCAECATGLGSFTIAASIPAAELNQDTSKEHAPVLSTCAQFVTEIVSPAVNYPILSYLCGSRQQPDLEHEQNGEPRPEDNLSDTSSSSARALWETFTTTGDILDIDTRNDREKNVSRAGTRVGGAVCLRQCLQPATSSAPVNVHDRSASSSDGNSKIFSFSVSWDHPYVRFGSSGGAAKAGSAAQDSTANANTTGRAAEPTSQADYSPLSESPGGMLLPRYYTRFFGISGLASPTIAAFALSQVQDWRLRIAAWQAQTLLDSSTSLDAAAGSATGAAQQSKGSYYDSQLFNELYFLVDGGTVWTDSTAGVSNQARQASQSDPNRAAAAASTDYTTTRSGHLSLSTEHTQKEKDGSGWCSLGAKPLTSEEDLLMPLTGKYAPDSRCAGANDCGRITSAQLSAHLSSTLCWPQLHALHRTMHAHDAVAQGACGDQCAVGQFLYLEGHEYLMYNTYDVHFYASFALLMLWPQLELSLQRDFIRAVAAADDTTRVMMGTGDLRPRKVKGVVPHDLGSPSEAPWARTNAYNFQDVSRWKDLGPKFVLQIYRDYYHLHSTATTAGDATTRAGLDAFLGEVYPVLLTVMRSTQAFDTDGDGMIENSGFPDQTYDIWTATGVHAYCGGGDQASATAYRTLSDKARAVYLAKLWNGRYLNYDSSSSAHHDSIMADMLAGQWYARACDLPPLLSPRMALSCFRTIYQHNVVDFGEGRLLGAVNGMRPPPEYNTTPGQSLLLAASLKSVPPPASPTSDSDEQDLLAQMPPNLTAPIVLPPVSKARVDNSCMQSREVWTGTTYALAAAMLQEALYHHPLEPATPPAAGDLTPAEGLTTTDSDSPAPFTPLVSSDKASSVLSATAITTAAFTTAASLTTEPLDAAERAELLQMAHHTAQGIHDAGWQAFGYWFATPEGWERNGNYRSLGYMRALGIWAMQYAKNQAKDVNKM